MTTIAIVGIGYWGKNLLRVFSRIATVSTCVHTGSPSNREWIEKNHPTVKLTTSLSEVLENPDIQAIVVATPIETHYDIVEKALKAGKEVFVEKPLTESPDQSDKLRRLASKKDCVLFVGYILQYHPVLDPVLEKSRKTELEFGRFTWHKYGDFKEDILLDLATHPISVVASVINLGSKCEQLCRARSTVARIDEMVFDLSFTNGAHFLVEIDRESPVENKSAKFVFGDGSRYFWTEDELFLARGKREPFETVCTQEKEPLLAECERFLSAIEGERYPTDGSHSVAVNRVVKRLGGPM